jgi:hypothetical protein
VNLNMMTSYEENVGVLRYASLAHEIEALPASELGGCTSRSPSGEVKAEGTLPCPCPFHVPGLFPYFKTVVELDVHA